MIRLIKNSLISEKCSISLKVRPFNHLQIHIFCSALYSSIIIIQTFDLTKWLLENINNIFAWKFLSKSLIIKNCFCKTVLKKVFTQLYFLENGYALFPSDTDLRTFLIGAKVAIHFNSFSFQNPIERNLYEMFFDFLRKKVSFGTIGTCQRCTTSAYLESVYSVLCSAIV